MRLTRKRLFRFHSEPFELRQGMANLCMISWNSSSPVQLLKRLPGECATHIRRLCRREERCLRKLFDAMFPPMRSSLGWIDGFDASAFHLLDCVDNPPSLHLDARRPVTKSRRAMWSVRRKEVGIAADRHSEVGVNGCGPFIFERCPFDAAEAHVHKSTGGDVEPGGNAYCIELVVRAVGQPDPSLGDALNGVLSDIDQLDRRSVELLEVIDFQAGSFHTPWMGRFTRGKKVSSNRVFNTLAYPASPEIINNAVGFHIMQTVLVVGNPESEATRLP